MKTLVLGLAVSGILLAPAATEAEEKPAVVTDLEITVLSTMLTELRGIGEWGFSAFIEVDGHTVLFDTGERPETVLKNADELGIDLSTIDTVILSHNHFDHTGGLVTLRRNLKDRSPSAVQTTHVGEGIFLPRVLDPQAVGALPPIPSELLVSAVEVREGYEAAGGEFVVHDKPHELYPGVWITGPIPRVHPEKNWTPFMKIRVGDELIEDTIPEDQAVVFDTPRGLVILVGCGHAGIVNTMEYARSITEGRPIYAVLGGLHLLNASDQHLKWTGTKMAGFGVEHVLGAHCTGLHAVTGLRDAGGLSRTTAMVGAVGSAFTLNEGIRPGALNR
jgi:7,8-dihydropterin-6-yl-methyl-4-(beta-D-ribofuranosyl)aminobenzene 5'-phosphate synthase